MKTIFRTIAVAALVITASCGKDKVEAIIEEFDEQTEQLEQTPLEANTVSDNVLIAGATKEEGAPPTPNEAISLDTSNSGGTAFLNEGFEISLNSDSDIVGAYLQFKSNDGTLADGYHDINIASNISGKKFIGKSKNKKDAFSRTAKIDNTNLDIDFNAQIEPGTFCYAICVYDGQGNISAPSEVCVTVESWGGSAAVVGKWSFVKEEITENGETEVFSLGDPDCDEWTALCNNGQELEMSVCYTQEYGILELKSDGSFVIDFKGVDQNYDDAAFGECELVYTDDTVYRYQSAGNWAFVADEMRLTLVEYSYTTEEDGTTETENVEEGNAELIYDGVAQVSGNSFVLIEEDNGIGDGTNDYTYKFYFEK